MLLADVFPNAIVGHAAEDAVGKKERGVIGVIARDGGKDRYDHGLGDALAIDINDAVVSGGGRGHGRNGRRGSGPAAEHGGRERDGILERNVAGEDKGCDVGLPEAVVKVADIGGGNGAERGGRS